MPDVINLIIAILLFCIAVWAALELLRRFEVPKPIWWVVGVLFVIILLLWLGGQIPTPQIYKR